MQQSEATKTRSRHATYISVVACFIYLTYLLTFSGIFKANDERLLIDAANSLVLQQSNYTSQTVNEWWGLLPIDTELAQPLLAAPLYWMAYHIPVVGNIHVIFLFNLIVTVITAAVLYYFALDLGYEAKNAVIGVLLFGLTTIAWPYAQSFFREPLAGLLLLSAAFSLDKWRRAFATEKANHWRRLAVSAAIVIAALLSKEALFVALPAMVAFAYPGSASIRKNWHILAAVAIGLVLVLGALGVTLFTLREQIGLSASRYRLLVQMENLLHGLPSAWEGLSGFLLSPGKGIWWYSPILLLALGAPLVLPRSRWRESWLPLLLTVWFALVYAAIKGPIWSGGAGWGPRFMVPLTPILMLAALPLIDRMLNSPHYWPKAVLALLGLFGLLIQIGGTYVNLYDYYAQIEAGTSHFVWEGPAIWTFRWSQAIGSLLHLPHAKTDIICLPPSPNYAMISLLSVGLILLGGAIVWAMRRPNLSLRVWSGIASAGPVLAIVMTVIAFWFARDDPRYQHDIDELESLQAHLSQNAGANDIIMLSTPAYSPYFLNWYKGKPIWYNLPYSPGERSSWEQEPAVVSDKVEELISPTSVQVFQGVLPGGILYRGGSLWLVVDSSQFHPWSTRPPEWYLAKYTYTVGVTEFSTTVRLIQYLPLLAPETNAAPARALNAKFGEGIRLRGYDVTTDTSKNPADRGGMLAISLLWEADGQIPIDYTVGVYLLDAGGAVVLQQDRWPVGGFAPTSKWKVGEAIRDNYGFIIPDTLSPGEYRVAVAVYDWASMTRLPVLNSDDTPQKDLLILEAISID